MLRYIYLLCLLLCIELTICYEYSDYTNNNSYRHADRRIRKGRNRSGSDKRKRQYILRSGDFEIKNPVAQFDVSSFIRSPEEDAYEENKKQRTSKDNDYGSYLGVDAYENIKKRDKGTDYSSYDTDSAPELNASPQLMKDAINGKHFNLNTLSLNEVNARFMHPREDKAAKGNFYNKIFEDRNIHKPEKKCALKHLQFPFFSRTKPVTKTKKGKQSTICTNCSKKDEINDIPQTNNIDDHGYKVNKRSYEETLCPECRNKVKLNDRLKHSATGFIHNGRQFYQNVKDLAKYRSKHSKLSKKKNNRDNFDDVTNAFNSEKESKDVYT